MAKNKKNDQLSKEGKTELAKAIAEKSQSFAQTYAHIEIAFSKFFRWVSGWLDRVLFNQKHGKAVALFIAIIVYATFNSGESNIFETTKSALELGEFPVSQVISTQNFEVSGLPEKVKITAVGDLADVQSMKQKSGFRVVADMTNLTEGEHEVQFLAEGGNSRVELLMEPSCSKVTIKRKSIRRFSVGYDFLNRSSMDSIYDLSAPIMEQGEVLVRASRETLDSIAFVKALIPVNKDIVNDFETKATVYAYDQSGRRMDVDIIPKKIPVKVKVSKPSKEVSVVLSPSGVIPNGKAISTYKIDYPKVTIYGSASILATIDRLPIVIPASTLTSDKEISMPIILPNGVTKVSQNIVKISIKLDDEKKKVIDNVAIEMVNMLDGYQFTFEKENTTSVVVKGAKNIIDQIVVEDLTVHADVSKINKEGVYEIPLLVNGNEALANYELKDAVVQIRVEKIKK